MEIKFEFVQRVQDLLQNNNLSLPIKGSKNAAGYDFVNPEDVIIQPKEIKYVKTGVKSKFPEDMALLLLNRSSNPKKKGLILANGIGLIDADYYNNDDNEGEIAFAFMNITEEPILIKCGDKLGQGMFIKYFDITNLDTSNISTRTGGFGSTGK